ncbi:PREDICTED: uncharacterized protein LOC103334246 [Prunus mume]|uniref:Uncharacterized protein LOC103334246 n=1 Tax=Prunus mume TaxID=102107 RepID=A0ABM1LSK1_PRUMU|nr:PREDICTED: uncharacterized protein LOC103334246 [Prunus mume]
MRVNERRGGMNEFSFPLFLFLGFFNGRDRGLHCFSDSFYFHKNPRPTDNSRQRVRVLLHYFQRVSDGGSGNRCGSRAAELAEGRFQRGSNQKPMALIKKLRKGEARGTTW